MRRQLGMISQNLLVPQRRWVLRELIHYLSNEASGALGFEDMGEDWVAVRKAGRDGTLRAGDVGARGVAERWDQFASALALSLSQDWERMSNHSERAGRPRPNALTSVSMDAPKDGTPRGRFGWLMRQLREAPGDLRLGAAFPLRPTTERACRRRRPFAAGRSHVFRLRPKVRLPPVRRSPPPARAGRWPSFRHVAAARW